MSTCVKGLEWGPAHNHNSIKRLLLLYRTNSGNLNPRDLKTQVKTGSLLMTCHASNNVVGSLGNYLYILICE